MRGARPNLRTDAPGALTVPPKAPAWLPPAAKAEWRRVIGDLVGRRIITAADLGSVENYTLAIARVREIEALMRSGFDPKLFRPQNQSLETARRLAAELGLTPVSRSRPTIRDDGQDDDLAGFDV